MSAPIPSVPSATGLWNRAGSAYPTALLRLDIGLWRIVPSRSWSSGRCTQWASSQPSFVSPRSRLGASASSGPSHTWMWTPTPSSSASAAAASSVSSEQVKAAWIPTRPRPPADRNLRFSSSPRLAPSAPCRSVTPYAVITRTPTSAQASAMTDNEPSIALGDSWWSMMAVVPCSSASSAPNLADHSIISRSSATSRRHQICSRMPWKVVGVSGGAGMPRANVE